MYFSCTLRQPILHPSSLWLFVAMTIIINPDYPKTILSFSYQGFTIEINIDDKNEETITYSSWVGYDYGWAMATPAAKSRAEAIREGKRWVDVKLNQSQS